jgi:transcriptional regulator with XRE-family HTH domain
VRLAERLRVGQGQISRTERQSDLLLSTLIAYLRALGVDAELTIRVKGKTIHHSLTDPREETR